jgi:pimeloyl-ACP methyl ester carboxylesterase
MKYIYLHGFASSPASSKARYFQERMREHGVDLVIPELDRGDFEHLTLSGQLSVIQQTHGSGPAVLLGSSMGGYVAAIYASMHPEIVRIVLLAPAFDFVRRFPKVTGDKQFAEWKSSGKIKMFHYGVGRECLLDFGLYEDARKYPAFPDVSQPALVLHGINDETVPVQLSEQFCAAHPNCQLHVLHSGHELTNVLPEMWALTERFLFNE